MISVVIPVFNRPEKLERAVLSVLGQHELASDELEIIVVDDTSHVPVALEHVDPRIRILRHERNGGPSAARNTGIRASRGDLIALLDSDDVWLPNKLSRQVTALRNIEQNQDSGALIGLVCDFACPDRFSGRLEARSPAPTSDVATLASGCWYCPGSTLLARAEVFAQVGPYDERLRRLEDLDWAIRFGRLGGRLAVASMTGAVVAPSNTTNFAAVAAASSLILEKFGADGRQPLDARSMRNLQAYLALERCAAALGDGQHATAMSEYMASLWYKPRLGKQVCDFGDRKPETSPDVLAAYAVISAADSKPRRF